MIVIKLQGGLGNQLFQYATARTLAHHHSTSVAFDLRSLQGTPEASNITPRSYELSAFGIDPVQPPLLDSLRYGLTAVALPKPLGLLVRRWKHVTEYREKAMGYDADILKKTSANTYLIGYFQSERYFENIRDILRNELSFINASNRKILPDSPTTVSLHIRRGDYVTNPKTRQVHGLCSLDYYQKAAAYLADRLGDIHLVVFSDDLAWAREHLLLPYPITFVDGHEGQSSYKDMQLMSRCHHHITANSSFSWWGAWLNPSPDKIVVAPSRWLAHEKDPSESADRIPTGWIRI